MCNSEHCIFVRKIIEDWILCVKLNAYRYTTCVRLCCKLSFSQQKFGVIPCGFIWDSGGSRAYFLFLSEFLLDFPPNHVFTIALYSSKRKENRKGKGITKIIAHSVKEMVKPQQLC
jgi:hypothetical protein